MSCVSCGTGLARLSIWVFFNSSFFLALSLAACALRNGVSMDAAAIMIRTITRMVMMDLYDDSGFSVLLMGSLGSATFSIPKTNVSFCNRMSDGVRLLGSSLTPSCFGPHPDHLVSTCPHASLPPRRLRLRAHLGLQS